MAVVQVRDGVGTTRKVAVEREMKKRQVLYWSKDILYGQNKDHFTSVYVDLQRYIFKF